MEIIKLPKKFRDVCYQIMDGHVEMLSTLESFVKYPHQVTAVKAEVAYFDMDYRKALECDLEILPFFDEWYYGNVGSEHRAAMVVAAIKLGKEKEVIKRFNETQKFLRQNESDIESSTLKTTLNNIKSLKKYLKESVLPFSDNDLSYYHQPASPKSLDELKKMLPGLINKKHLDTPYGRLRLFFLAFQQGTPSDAVRAFEDIENTQEAENAYEDAIKLFHFLGEKQKTLEIIKRYATSRMWHVASATQVRPMSFFLEPIIVDYLTNPETLAQIREAAEIDNGTLIRT